MQRSLIILLCTFTLTFTSCGGAELEVEQPVNPRVAEADQAISIIRQSFDAMGGIERLRLAGSRAKITGTAIAAGDNVPFEIMLGGPNRHRLDYVDNDISYIHDNGKCLKIIFGIPAQCDAKEAQWSAPVKILTGLTFPAGDAANLNSTFRMREDIFVNGASCAVPELRPKNTNIKIRAAYDKTSHLLTQTSFYFKDDAGVKSTWEVNYGDWRMSKKMNVPFSKTVSNAGSIVWQETLDTVNFDGFDDRAFLSPLPPTENQALSYMLPTHRFVKSTISDQAVKIIAPYVALGAGRIHQGGIESTPSTEIVRLIHRGLVAEAGTFFDQVMTAAASMGKQTTGVPKVMLLETPTGEDEPVLMIIYVEIAKQNVTIKMTS